MSSSHSLRQVNHIRNQRGVTLDLIFCTDPDIQVSCPIDCLVAADCHHPPLAATLCFPGSAVHSECHKGHNLWKCDLPAVFKSIQCADLSFVDQQISVDDKFDRLVSLLEESTLLACPMKSFGTASFPKWFSGDLKRLVIQKKIAHRRFKSTLNPIHYHEFSSLRNACKVLARECHSHYLSNVAANISSNPRAFWGLVKSQRKSPDMPPILYLDGSEAKDSASKSDLFSVFFSSVFSPPSSLTSKTHYPTSDCIHAIRVGEEELKSRLENLDVRKGAGIDNIPPSVLHYCRDILTKPLLTLFNESLSKGIFPKALKRGYIIPLHKTGDPSNIRNFRPIAILSVIGKVFESFVVDRLNVHFSRIIHPSQHGFVRGKSTVSNLLLFQEYVLAAFRKHKQVDSVYIDMAKAFDKVDHSVLISKLEGCGVSDPLLSWLADYLHDRRLTVRIGPSDSMEFSPTSGVPQGSLLGPCLFNIFVNDLLEVISVNALQFADDLKIFTSISSDEDSQKMQQSLSAIEDWCALNGMSVNPTKCSTVIFHRKKSPIVSHYSISGIQIPRSPSIKDLGVHFDEDMGFSTHLDYICNQASKMLGFISRFSKGINNPAALRSLYCSFVRQLIEYASPVWSPFTASARDRLEAIQRRFIRLVGVRLGFGYLEVPVDDLSRNLNLPPLALRRDVSDVVLLLKILNGLVQCPNLLAEFNIRLPSITRSQEILSRGHYLTNYDYNSPIARFVRLGNQVATECDLFFDKIPVIRRRALDIFSR